MPAPDSAPAPARLPCSCRSRLSIVLRLVVCPPRDGAKSDAAPVPADSGALTRPAIPTPSLASRLCASWPEPTCRTCCSNAPAACLNLSPFIPADPVSSTLGREPDAAAVSLPRPACPPPTCWSSLSIEPPLPPTATIAAASSARAFPHKNDAGTPSCSPKMSQWCCERSSSGSMDHTPKLAKSSPSGIIPIMAVLQDERRFSGHTSGIIVYTDGKPTPHPTPTKKRRQIMETASTA
mmetsp:Transcript_19413/g.48616  ORF Transcript_19413/g.48616 Transcript_19413/m.48616 type:complete len:237 (+) Transcript_19413:1643-2353(+)